MENLSKWQTQIYSDIYYEVVNSQLDVVSKQNAIHLTKGFTSQEHISSLGMWWLSGRFGALRPQGCRFEHHSSRHVRPFTHNCLYNMTWRLAWLPCGSIRLL